MIRSRKKAQPSRIEGTHYDTRSKRNNCACVSFPSGADFDRTKLHEQSLAVGFKYYDVQSSRKIDQVNAILIKNLEFLFMQARTVLIAQREMNKSLQFSATIRPFEKVPNFQQPEVGVDSSNI